MQIDCGRVLQRLLDQIGQLEVLEEHVEELFLGQRELERVLARAVGAALAATAVTAALRARDFVATHIFLVARNDMVAAPGAPAVMENRLGDAARRDGDLLTMLDIGHFALTQRILHRPLDLGSGALQEPLAVAEALALRVLAAIDNVHRRFSGSP